MEISASSFPTRIPDHLQPGEHLVRTWVMQHVQGPRNWKPGLLALTDRRVLFFEATRYKTLSREPTHFDVGARPTVSISLARRGTALMVRKGPTLLKLDVGTLKAVFVQDGFASGRAIMASAEQEINRGFRTGGAAAPSSPPPPGPAPQVVVKETIREIVKVPCPYCGTLRVVTDPKCGSCGAPARA